MKAVLLISHGSRSPKTKQEIARLVNELKRKSKVPIFEFAFLEIERPSIPEGIRKCVDSGAREIRVLLNFLNSGRHVDRDIPRIIRDARTRYPKIKFTITRPVGQHPEIAGLFLDLL